MFFPSSPFVFLHGGYGDGAPLFFNDPIDILSLWTLEESHKFFNRLEEAHLQGNYLAGYFSYELGLSFETQLRTLIPKSSPLPLARIGVFSAPQSICFHDDDVRDYGKKEAELSDFYPLWSFETYREKFFSVQKAIKAGDVYQINLSFPLEGGYKGNSFDVYSKLKAQQNTPYGGFVALGEENIASLSPELFFEIKGQTIKTRPMKGTAPRGLGQMEDQDFASSLLSNPKQRSENLMIVDLMRNDLSKICQIGTVKTPKLFTLESYPTLHQMTSTVVGTLLPSLSFYEIFKALFPGGSITGAPKIRAMELISHLEERSRGGYCGGIGVIMPNGSMCFNVAIRTLTFFSDQKVLYNVGSGIVAESSAEAEYHECLLKAKFLKKSPAS